MLINFKESFIYIFLLHAFAFLLHRSLSYVIVNMMLLGRGSGQNLKMENLISLHVHMS